MTSTTKMLKKIHDQNERKSLVKELIALRPISPVETNNSHPFQTIYEDSNPPPAPIDQFAPYLSRLLTMKRAEKVEKMKSKIKVPHPTFVLTNSVAKSDDSDKSQGVSEYFQTARVETSAYVGSSIAHHIKMEECFDRIVSASSSVALHRLFESSLQVYFLAERVLFYHDISSVKVLYCPSTTAYCPHGTGLVGYAQFSRKTLNIPVASDHVSYHLLTEGNQCPPDAHVLVFPIFDNSSHVKCVVQVIRNKTSPVFTEDDERFVGYLQNKCKIYSRWLFQPVLDDSFAADLMHTCRLRQFMESIKEKLTRLFGCRSAEIWMLNKKTEAIIQYTSNDDKPIQIPSNEAGIPGFALRKEIPVSCITSRVHSAYNSKTDGNGDYSILAMPVRDPDSSLVYLIALRGRRIPQFFTDNDEKILARIASYVISALCSAEIVEQNHKALEESLSQQQRLRSLLEVAETLAGQLRMDVLIPNIMKRACELVNADRCSLFLVNDTHDKLVTTFNDGLKNSIEIPIDAGIVGLSATTGKILNIKDAYEEPKFNKGTDLATGYRTLTLLCVPIYDDKKDIRGVTEMINKIDGVFTKEDEKLIQIFNVFCGISIENARLYRASLDLTMQLHSFRDISTSLSQTQTIKKLLEEIIRNTRTVIGAVYSYLYLTENSEIVLTPFVKDEDLDITSKKAMQMKEGKVKDDNLGVKRAIINRLMHGHETDYNAEEKKEEESRNKIITHVINMKESILENDPENYENNLIVVPIMSSDRQIMGTVMMRWKKNCQKFTTDELKLLESYSVFLSLSLERFRLKNIAQLGTIELELQNSMNNDERIECKTPQKLSMSEEERGALLLRNFEATDWKGNGTIQVLFNIFETFNLMSFFKINAQTLFSFLFEIKNTYNPVFYHNWTHAVDVTQFLAHELVISGMKNDFTPLEILTMLVASICHDANHDGFSNSYNLKAQTPLGVLFKNQSVMETHHCSVSIGILTKDECNIFQALDENNISQMWPLFINLILSTDMAKHFEILDQANAFLRTNEDWRLSNHGRMLVMQLLIKAADISNVARSFETADRWVDVLCEEFFKQGDLERAHGMEYSSPMNDREHLDKAKSQIGFYQSVCLPLFKTLSNYSQQCIIFVNQLNTNLNRWAERSDIAEKERKLMLQKEIEDKKKEEELRAIQIAQEKDAEEIRKYIEEKSSKTQYLRG